MNRIEMKQDKKILNCPAAIYRFNDVVVLILSGLTGRFETVSSDLWGQVVFIVVSMIALHWFIN